MSTGNTEGKGSSGARFKIPPAAIWNNMVDAGRAWADDRLSSQGGTPIRPRATDIIKIKNTSGDARRAGEILKIEGNALDTIVAEHIWLLGVEPTTDCYFGILKKPAETDGVEDLQVSGCCMALVDIIDVDHTRADVVDGEYVLESSFSGPLEILYAPASTGEQLCVMRFFAGNPPDKAVIIDANIAVATDAKTGATSGLATVCEWSQDDEEFTETTSQITVWNHSETTSHDADTFGVARWIAGHWWFFGDCNAMAGR